MQDASALDTIALVERDLAGESMVAWSFPLTSAELQHVLVGRTDFGSKVRARASPRRPLPHPATRRLPARDWIPCTHGSDSCRSTGSLPTFTRSVQAYFSRFEKQWIFTVVRTAGLPSAASPRINAFAIHLHTRVYHPERWMSLANLLADAYAATGDATVLLDLFLAAYRRDEAVFAPASPTPSGGGARWALKDVEDGAAYLTGGRLAGLSRLLGDYTVLLWTAILLHRRVVVFAPTVSDLNLAVRGLPLMVPHRGRTEWDRLRPYVTDNVLHVRPDIISDATAALPTDPDALAGLLEARDLARCGWFIAGVTSAGFATRPDLWDAFVDIPAGTVVIADHAKPSFILTPLHKRLADTLKSALVGPAEEGTPDERVARALALASREVVERLKTIAAADPTAARVGTQAVLTLDALRASGIPSPTLEFLWEIARAEPSIPTAEVASGGSAGGAGSGGGGGGGGGGEDE